MQTVESRVIISPATKSKNFKEMTVFVLLFTGKRTFISMKEKHFQAQKVDKFC
jgi:hypothetical protein